MINKQVRESTQTCLFPHQEAVLQHCGVNHVYFLKPHLDRIKIKRKRWGNKLFHNSGGTGSSNRYRPGSFAITVAGTSCCWEWVQNHWGQSVLIKGGMEYFVCGK